MILSDTAILAAMKRGEIVIDPFDRNNLGGNSYDVRLSAHIKILSPVLGQIDCAADHVHSSFYVKIPSNGYVMLPGRLYLASTIEYTETHRHVPYLDGRSSVARLGISIHATAGRGDVGFCNHWTMEITVVYPTRVYAGMRVGQLTYHNVEGEVDAIYTSKKFGTYGQAPRNPYPVPSGMHKSIRRDMLSVTDDTGSVHQLQESEL